MNSTTLLTAKRGGLTISYIDREEFDALWGEIFRVKQYVFSCKTDTPFIIDCGAHIGLSILYFKRCYPRAHIIAFEPNPQTFEILTQNIKQNHLEDVQLINAAASTLDGETQLYTRCDTTTRWGDTGLKGAIVGSEQQWRAIPVKAVRLSSYITRPTDYIKMDIEGMEETVLHEIEEKLPLINEIRLEFHYTSTNTANDIERILAMLHEHDFKCIFESGRRVVSMNENSPDYETARSVRFHYVRTPKLAARLVAIMVRTQNYTRT